MVILIRNTKIIIILLISSLLPPDQPHLLIGLSWNAVSRQCSQGRSQSQFYQNCTMTWPHSYIFLFGEGQFSFQGPFLAASMDSEQ